MYLNQIWIISLSLYILKLKNIIPNYYLFTAIEIVLIFISGLITEMIVKLMTKVELKFRNLIICQ